MGRALYESQPAFRAALDACDELLRAAARTAAALGAVSGGRRGVACSTQTAYTQPALFALEYALAELWRSWGVEPAAVLGHSVGEYVAACVAGVLHAGGRAAPRRGARPPDAGAAGRRRDGRGVRADEAAVSRGPAQAAGRVAIAATNGPKNTVISGEDSGCRQRPRRTGRAGIAGQRLNVSHAFHSALVDPVLDAFEAEAARITPAQARLVMASNLTGAIAPSDFVWNAAYWRRQTRERVRFAEGLAALHDRGVRIFLEVGPQPTLINLARATIPGAETLWLPSLQRGGDAWKTVAQSLAQLYARGVAVDWTGFDRGYRRRKVAVPTYPFQRERFWMNPAPRRESPPKTPLTPDAAGSLLYDVRWIHAREAAPRLDARSGGRWILIADHGGVARLVQDELVRQGLDSELFADAAAIAPREQEPDPSGTTRVLDFRALDLRDAGDLPAALSGLAALFQRLSSASGNRVWMITSGAQPAGGGDQHVAVAQAPVWGFSRVAALEHPDVWGGLVDLDPGMPVVDQIPAIVSDLLAFDGEDQVAYRGGRRLVARLRPATPGLAGPVTLSPDAAYLITGGPGSLGLHVARRFVERGARHLVLLARSVFPPRAQWAEIDRSHAQWNAIEHVRQLEALGADVTIAQGDVSSPEDITRVIAGIHDRGIALRGVVHAAGTVRQSPVARSTSTELDAVLRAKTIGTLALQEATKGEPLDFFVMFSSISAVWGSKHLAAYAAANHFLDAVAHDRRARGYPALSVNWGPWADGGMTTTESSEWLAQLGLRPLAPAEGVDALVGLMASPMCQAVVAHVDWSRFLPVYTAAARRPLLEELAAPPEHAAGAGDPGPAVQSARHDRDAIAAIMAAAPAARLDLVRDLLLRQIAGVLRLPDVNGNRPLTDLGIDSLMAIELRNEIQRSLGVVVPMVTFLDGSTGDSLAAWIAGAIPEAGGPGSVLPDGPRLSQLTPAEAEALLGRVHELSEAEVDALLSALGAGRDAS